MANDYARNNFGVDLGARLESTDTTNSPNTQTFHGLSILMNNQLIGRIQKWNPKMFSRKGEHIYELNASTYGRPVDYVPGINDAYTIACEKVEIWGQDLELALGYEAVWHDLMDQTRPFTVRETFQRGGKDYRAVNYSGCWFTDKNYLAFDAGQNPTIKMTADIAFISRKVVPV